MFSPIATASCSVSGPRVSINSMAARTESTALCARSSSTPGPRSASPMVAQISFSMPGWIKGIEPEVCRTRMHTVGEQKAEDRLANPKLALDGFGGEPDLQSYMRRAIVNQASQDAELDPTRVLEREPVVPRGWK